MGGFRHCVYHSGAARWNKSGHKNTSGREVVMAHFSAIALKFSRWVGWNAFFPQRGSCRTRCATTTMMGHHPARHLRRLIALAYYSIPLTLVYFVRKRKDVAFDLDVCLLRHFHRGLRHHALDGNSQYLDADVLAFRPDQGDHGPRVRGHSHPPHPPDPAGAGAAQSPEQLRKSNAALQKRNPRAHGSGEEGGVAEPGAA